MTPSARRRPRKFTNMPGLTVDTSPQSQSQSSQGQSPSNQSGVADAVRPPVSPITPTLEPARLAASSNPSPSSNASNANSAPPRQTYTHSQPRQTAIPQSAPVPITLDENTDALALKSAMSILQIQARNAENDIRNLARLKERALGDPEGFAEALAKGKVNMKKDSLFNPSADDDDDEEDEDEEMADVNGESQEGAEKRKKDWPKIPAPQNVVRMPPINWQKYGVVGESLDKLHADQRARPTEGKPQIIGPDGSLRYGGDGTRRPANLGIASPYTPGRDKIEKMSTRKGGKR